MRYKEFANLFENGPATTSDQQYIMGGVGISSGRYSAKDDKLEKANIKDTRKQKITLKMLNRLKMIRAAKKLETLNKSKVLSIMYSTPPEEDKIS